MEQTFQYYIYGIVVPYKKIKDKIKEYEHTGDAFGVFFGKDGKFIILGKVLDEDQYFGNDKPFIISTLEEIDEFIIRNQVKDNFGITGKFHYYFVVK